MFFKLIFSSANKIEDPKTQKNINKIFNGIDNNIEEYIQSLSYIDLNSLLGHIKQYHKKCIQELFIAKVDIKILKELRCNFDKNVIFTLFDSYKELVDYAKKNIDNIFNNKKFNKK